MTPFGREQVSRLIPRKTSCAMGMLLWASSTTPLASRSYIPLRRPLWRSQRVNQDGTISLIRGGYLLCQVPPPSEVMKQLEMMVIDQDIQFVGETPTSCTLRLAITVSAVSAVSSDSTGFVGPSKFHGRSESSESTDSCSPGSDMDCEE